jgi:ribosomal protein L40E
VSHLKERKEKICLNCQATLYARYCHECGQENLEPKETVWHLVQHFFNDITHFDGKFFATVKYLMRKPGFLSSEYVAGRRASYLNPIRLYVFTSAIFFLILFALKDPKDLVHTSSTPDKGQTLAELKKERADKKEELAGADDKGDSLSTTGEIVKLDMELAAIHKYYGDSTTRIFSSRDLGVMLARGIGDSVPEARELLSALSAKSREKVYKRIHKIAGENADTARAASEGDGSSIFGINYKSQEEYDSAQNKLPDSLRDGWLERVTVHKLVAANMEFRRDPKEYLAHVAENIMHSIPKVLFVSLPIFALILNILYFRRKKQFYYVDHGIFTIHLYCATFILTMTSMLLYQLGHFLGVGWLKVVLGIVIFALCVWTVIYLYKAMRGFYRQGRFKTFLKYFLVCWLAFFVNMIIFVIFILLSVVSV